MATTHLDIGDIWQPVWTFKVGTTNTDPTTIVAKKMDPAGAVTTITENTPAAPAPPIVRTGAGVFRYDIPITAAGYWYASMTGTGAVVAAEQHEAIADPDPFTSNWGLSTRALVGLGETKDWLNSQNIKTAEDMEIVRVINDLSDRFHQEAGREFKVSGTNPQTRTFSISYANRDPWYVDGDFRGYYGTWARGIEVGDMAAVPTQVQILDTDWTTILETVAAGDITAHPLVRQSWEPIRRLEFQTDVTGLSPGMRVAVTGTFGFPSVPGTLRQAVLDAVAEVLDRDVEHYRQDFAPVETGEAATVVVIGRTGSRMISLPPRALAVAWSYRDPFIA